MPTPAIRLENRSSFIPFRVPRCHRQRALWLTQNDTPSVRTPSGNITEKSWWTYPFPYISIKPFPRSREYRKEPSHLPPLYRASSLLYFYFFSFCPSSSFSFSRNDSSSCIFFFRYSQFPPATQYFYFPSSFFISYQHCRFEQTKQCLNQPPSLSLSRSLSLPPLNIQRGDLSSGFDPLNLSFVNLRGGWSRTSATSYTK